MRNRLLTNNTSANTIAAGGVIPLGSAIHGYGRNIKLNGDSITINGNGYYEFIANASVAVTGTGTVTMQLYENGVAVSGAVASATPSAATGVVNLTLPWLIRKSCCCEGKTYSLVLSAAGTVNGITVMVEGD